jgi:hypothetical protein
VWVLSLKFECYSIIKPLKFYYASGGNAQNNGGLINLNEEALGIQGKAFINS